MDAILWLVLAYSIGASVLVGLSPVLAQHLGVPAREMVGSTFQAVIAFPFLIAGLVAVVLLLASA